MASENIGSIYPTQIPGYDDAADIQAALKLYHYGNSVVPTIDEIGTSPGQIVANSVVGHIKALDTRLDVVESTGIGSDYSSTEPTSPEDGFIWVDSDSVVPIIENPTWQLIGSGTLSGTSLSVPDISGEKFYVVLKDWSHSNTGSELGLVIRFNSDSGPNYVNTGGLISASGLSSPTFANTATQDLTIEVDLSNTGAFLKPVSTIADTSEGPYFGYYKSTNEITSVQLTLSGSGNFDGGDYQVWSYQV
jgi:hypothetical protein